MKQKILAMLELQDAMNSRINSDWRSAGNEWYRAIWIECAEMLDHYGWKWWKHQQPDMPQVILEVVDIWHFMLSDLLENETDPQQLAARIEVQFTQAGDLLELPMAIEQLAQRTLEHKSADVPAFVALLQAVSLAPDDLYRQYIGKNVLNFFRQDHGYRDGSYIKLWNGREDNEYLVQSIAELDSDSSSFQQDLYQCLEQHYQQHCSVPA
ncbi:MAG: dUTP diphosphatase [Chromatiales bacterium]